MYASGSRIISLWDLGDKRWNMHTSKLILPSIFYTRDYSWQNGLCSRHGPLVPVRSTQVLVIVNLIYHVYQQKPIDLPLSLFTHSLPIFY